ncbi:UDP-N-acetylmuramoyl-L-alanine--D-glutamate ligase [Corticimicrobacter populi]|uniref:UDP-N-acetylmuramoylalanine--D-glutamate ligase n=1 Tax=Corticimicrobacter populi TaxID=2175229 RepID=A0A2V1K094_9BURK|nr:UDP-N-acetylmuramoyl-L-alanine--D-glutamate ligase [Corticimicrobacter populi]PWF22458.1 UDP-N-acetylmuramoyl-L-alanine--D-glutamate ligase [Corticimicrobacter populi]
MNDTVHASLPGPLTLIFGLGETGLAAARWCLRQGWPLRVADTRAQPAGLEALQSAGVESGLLRDVRLGDGVFDHDVLDGVGQLVLSPGLSPLEPRLAALLAEARVCGIEVVGEIELFARALAELRERTGYAPGVVAVTGTNGKTTVTRLTRKMLEDAGISAREAGNVSPAALDALMVALDEDNLPKAWVLELSSFQLETTQTLVPDAAVIMNLTQDHLDWHGSFEAYVAAKARLYGMSRIKIVNREDPAVLALVDDVVVQDVRTFGYDLPACLGDTGLESEHGVRWLAVRDETDFDLPAPTTGRRRKAGEEVPVSRAEGRLSRLMPLDALKLRGHHHALNVQAALLLARTQGAGWGNLLRSAREYTGEPHRTEFVRNVGGVDFVNDSKGTNVGATVAALDSEDRQVVLILGGEGKGQDFAPLLRPVKARVRHLVFIGRDGALIERALAASSVPAEHASSMAEAVAAAFAAAQPGDVVLLSPACASFDMFSGYPQRGRVFAEAVQELALERGEVA